MILRESSAGLENHASLWPHENYSSMGPTHLHAVCPLCCSVGSGYLDGGHSQHGRVKYAPPNRGIGTDEL